MSKTITVLLALITLLLFAGFRTPQQKLIRAENIVANRIVLTDENNLPRAMLTMQDGGPVLGFTNSSGNVQLKIGMTHPDIPTITFANEQGRPLIIISLTEKGPVVVGL